MRRTMTAGLALAAALGGGCSATNGPFGRDKLALPVGPSYVGGRGMQVYPTSPAIVANVKDALSDVGIRSIRQSEDPGGTIILEGKAADDRRARVTILKSGTRATVAARVGWLGDEPLTRALLDRIGNRQGTLPPQPTPAAEKPADPPSNPFLSRDAVPDEIMLRNQLNEGYSPNP